MRTVRFHEHGDPTVLRLDEIPAPEVGPRQVCVAVNAAALNHLDLWIRGGLPGLKIPLPHIPGSDAAGIVEAVGHEVTAFKPGDEVVVNPGTSCGQCPACQAGRDNLCPSFGIFGETREGVQQEFLVLDVEHLGAKPTNLSFTQAAALPLAAYTAWHMLVPRANLQPEETLLVLGAGSGVGSFAIQIGRILGARVIATASKPEQQVLARELGADEVLDHREAGFGKRVKALTGGRGADVVFEHIGSRTWPDSLKALAVGGRLVTCGATTGVKAEVNLQHLFYKRQSILGSTMGTRKDFEQVLKLAAQGELKPVIDRSFRFADAAEAHAYLDTRHGFGKVVLEGWD